jgi:hypothetical protein
MPRKDKARRSAHADLSAVAAAGAPELRRIWQVRRGSPPPPTLSARLMRAALAWDLQAEVWGGESPAIGRQWRAVMRRREEGARADAVVGGLAPPAATTGTRLLKSWGGVMHEVTVQDGGILWNGRVYGSLSAVARAMTGTPRNGPRFFGMREGGP